MATRSITTVRSKWVDEDTSGEWETYATVYLHNNGYLEGVGMWLYSFLSGLVVVNGILVGGGMPERYANGPGRLAAQMVFDMQAEHMNPEIVPNSGNHGEEYRYQIDVTFGRFGGEVSISVFDGPMTMFGDGGEDCTNLLFSGDVEAYGRFLSAQRHEDEDEEDE